MGYFFCGEVVALVSQYPRIPKGRVIGILEKVKYHTNGEK